MREYQVRPEKKINLAEWDPNDTGEFQGNKQQARAETKKVNHRLQELQEVLYAEHRHKILVVLQGMDTSGKDGAIHHVFAGVNPQGVRVANFKEPTQEELDHDYFWRIHYEEVVIARVHKLVPQEVWKKRFGQINSFEKMLAENETTHLKFYLHIDIDEQKNVYRHGWYRDWVIADTLVETFDGLGMKYPEPAEPLDDVVI